MQYRRSDLVGGSDMLNVRNRCVISRYLYITRYKTSGPRISHHPEIAEIRVWPDDNDIEQSNLKRLPPN